jgi:4-amino-4-deoxy-L-arabinose transferase-like glycosyltransferase
VQRIHSYLWLILGSLWFLLVLIPLFNRTFLPIDETRYITVAWEMWYRGDFLVPSFNGEVYHHKPPLLFWLIHLGWAIFGVNEWWARIIPGFFSLGSLWLVVHLAHQLWPQEPCVAQWAPFILLSGLLWSLFTSAVMFDMILAFFTLLGLVAIVSAWQNRKIPPNPPLLKGGISHSSDRKIPSNSPLLKGETDEYPSQKGGVPPFEKRGGGGILSNYSLIAWILLGIAIGFGVLTKGPVILLHLLPIALLAPLWHTARPFPWLSWYLGILGSVILGTLIALAWAIPAAIAGGEEFRQAIFWGQTAGRIVNSFAHNHPIWWYLPWLPVVLFPWLLWLPLWRGFRKLPHYQNDMGVRFCVVWLVVVFASFSLISGKQLHYLLPTVPGFALLTAYLLAKLPPEQQNQRWDMVLPGVVLILVGILFLVAPYLPASLPNWVRDISPLSGMILLLLGAILVILSFILSKIHFGLLSLSTMAILFSLIVPLTILRAAGPAYDLHQLSQQIERLQRTGETIVHFGQYHGQYQFLGRLRQPLPIVDEYEICSWFIQNPDGKLVVYFARQYQELSQHAEYVQAYRSKQVGILDVKFLHNACLKVMPLL